MFNGIMSRRLFRLAHQPHRAVALADCLSLHMKGYKDYYVEEKMYAMGNVESSVLCDVRSVFNLRIVLFGCPNFCSFFFHLCLK